MGRLFFILFIVSSLLACNRTVSDDTHLSTNTSREEIEDSLSQRIIELTDSIHCLNDSINKCLKQVKLSTPNVEVNLLLDSIDKAHKTELNIYIDSISRIEAQNDSISSVLAESGMAEHTWQQKVSQHIICIIILILLLLIVAGRFILRKILKYVSRKKEKKVKQEESGSEKSTDDTLSNEENENLMTHDSVSSVNEYPDSLQLLQTIQENQEKLLEKLENLPVEKQQEEKGKDCKNQEERIHSVVNQVIDRAKGEISKTLKKAIEEKQEQFRLEFEEKKNELKKEAEEKIARQKAKEIEDIRTNLELKQKEIQIEQLQYKLTCQQSDINQKATLQKELRNLNAQRDILLQEIIQHSDTRTKIEHILIDYKQKGHSKETLSEKDWRSLANELDQKDIILQYSNQFCFTPSEQNYCYLLLTDYSATDRGKLLQLTRQTVYRREHDILTA